MRTGNRKDRAGFTLVEVMVTLVLLAVAMLGFSRSMVSTMVAADTDREVRLSTEASRAVFERLSGAAFEEVFALYNSDPNDDPDGPGTGPGVNFDVEGLDPLPADPDGSVGRVWLPVVEVAGIPQLREDVQMPELGMPRDLSGDGVIDDLDHSGDYVILPVRVELDWQGNGGPAEVEFHSVLMGI